MVVVADPDWEQDRQRFIAGLTTEVTQRRSFRAADDRTSLWSPLARQFADIGRDLYTSHNVASVLRRVVEVAALVVPGASMASVTLRRVAEPLHAPARTDEVAVLLDELQASCAEGPFFVVTDPDGTGTATSADLAAESSWPQFGPQAADLGVRSVLSVGLFPQDGVRTGALNVFSSEPRGLAAADPDIVLMLAAFVAAALGYSEAVSEEELEASELDDLLPSSGAVERATRFLMERRHLAPDEAYDILRRGTADLIRTWRTPH